MLRPRGTITRQWGHSGMVSSLRSPHPGPAGPHRCRGSRGDVPNRSSVAASGGRGNGRGRRCPPSGDLQLAGETWQQVAGRAPGALLPAGALGEEEVEGILEGAQRDGPLVLQVGRLPGVRAEIVQQRLATDDELQVAQPQGVDLLVVRREGGPGVDGTRPPDPGDQALALDLRGDRQPERFEQFGMTVVEAMAAGAVPLVFGGGGPAEIVRDGVDGFLWRDATELKRRTLELISRPDLLASCRASATVRSSEFSREKFESAIDAVIAGDGTGRAEA